MSDQPASSQPTTGQTVLHVGANEAYHSLSSALAASRDGDLIQVDAGTYTNDTATVTHSVTIEGVGGMAHFQTTGDIANGKAILVDAAANLTIKNLEFSGATVADGNGAGIRYEAGVLTVQNSFFHDNQNGIVGGTVAGGKVTVDSSEFLHNGAGDGQTHALYVGQIASLAVSNSSFIDTNAGIDVKSRAATNDIHGNSFVDSSTGTTSYAIDLPDGGNGTITDNAFGKAASTTNRATIHFGGEDPNATGSLQVQSNQFYSDRNPTTAVLNQSHGTVNLVGDSLAANVSIPIDGAGDAHGNMSLTGVAPSPHTLF